MRRGKSFSLLVLLPAIFACTRSRPPNPLKAILDQRLQSSEVVEYELREYLMERAPKMPAPAQSKEWTSEANQIRAHLLNELVFHGWPQDWVNSPPHFEDRGLIESSKGYRMHKLRYEIVPGFWSAAILYEPKNLHGKVPAILDMDSHAGPPGKSVEYKQKLCINYALRGMIALNVEWLGTGELAQKENEHWFGAHLDLAGSHLLGLFYLAMRTALDYLEAHPHVDRNRIGMTGLSGGGWQTVVLSSLDVRVAVAVPVAGYSTLVSRLEGTVKDTGSVGDIEQNATDFLVGQDYSTLTAMRAPRPTLLIYNSEDECCFRAPLVKPYVFDQVKPFFRLYQNENRLQWHQNTNPGSHNYELDNRQRSYRFFTEYFGLPGAEQEIPVDSEIKKYDELLVGLPKANLTILGLARKLGSKIGRPAVPSDPSQKIAWAAAERTKLRNIVRYKPVSVQRAWTVDNTLGRGLESLSYRFEFNNKLRATGVRLKTIAAPDSALLTIILNDQGKSAAEAEVSGRLNRGEQVLALDLLLTGDASPEKPWLVAEMLAATGDRPLGMRAAQLIGIAKWAHEVAGVKRVRTESSGIRSQAVALIGAALEPTLFSELVIHQGMHSLRYLLDAPVPYQAASELFCLDLFRDFDLDRLAVLVEPTGIIQ